MSLALLSDTELDAVTGGTGHHYGRPDFIIVNPQINVSNVHGDYNIVQQSNTSGGFLSGNNVIVG